MLFQLFVCHKLKNFTSHCKYGKFHSSTLHQRTILGVRIKNQKSIKLLSELFAKTVHHQHSAFVICAWKITTTLLVIRTLLKSQFESLFSTHPTGHFYDWCELFYLTSSSGFLMMNHEWFGLIHQGKNCLLNATNELNFSKLNVQL